jgi:hypothetical protein
MNTDDIIAGPGDTATRLLALAYHLEYSPGVGPRSGGVNEAGRKALANRRERQRQLASAGPACLCGGGA